MTDARPELAAMAGRRHDLLVIGGGVTGAAIAWDAALRGLDVALVEKADFGHATSAATSKLIHGGLRYLQNLEFGLVRESLRERRIWETIAPHMVAPMPFLIPAYGRGLGGKPALLAGLKLYDLLAWDRNRLDDPDKWLPASRGLSRTETLALEPGLDARDLAGGVIYYDCQMHAPERLTLELILGARARGAHVANYAEAADFVLDGRRVLGARVRDREGGAEVTVEAALTINAAGPWADILADTLPGESRADLIRSKGIHLITRALSGERALAIQRPGGHFFVLPWRGHSIVGTTDTLFEGAPDALAVGEGDIGALLDVVNDGFPGARLGRADVRYAYAGLRPLVDAHTEIPVTSSYGASRKSEIFDHAELDRIEGLFSAIGGKYTTSRHLAEQVVDRAIARLGTRPVPCPTGETPLHGGEVGRFAEFVRRETDRHGAADAEVVAHLCRAYGARAGEVLALAAGAEELGARLWDQEPDIAAEIIYAIEHEMARSLDDVLFRRTGLGTLGDPGLEVVESVAELMARALGWAAARRRAEIDRALARYVIAS